MWPRLSPGAPSPGGAILGSLRSNATMSLASKSVVGLKF